MHHTGRRCPWPVVYIRLLCGRGQPRHNHGARAPTGLRTSAVLGQGPPDDRHRHRARSHRRPGTTRVPPGAERRLPPAPQRTHVMGGVRGGTSGVGLDRLIWRGEIYDIDLGHPVGHQPASVRPAVVVSTDIVSNGPGELVVVVYRSGRRPTGCEAMSSSTGDAAVSITRRTHAAIRSSRSPRNASPLGGALPDSTRSRPSTTPCGSSSTSEDVDRFRSDDG